MLTTVISTLVEEDKGEIHGNGLKNGRTMLRLPRTAYAWEINFRTAVGRTAERCHPICVNYDGFDEEKNKSPLPIC